MPIVTDSSTIIACWFEDYDSSIRERLNSFLREGNVFVPALLLLELENFLTRSVQAKGLPQERREFFIKTFQLFNINYIEFSDWASMERIHELAIKYQVTVYDATFLDVALRHQIPLATLDKDLIRAAQQAKIPLL